MSANFTLVMQAFALCLIIYYCGYTSHRLLQLFGEWVVRKLFPKDADPDV